MDVSEIVALYNECAAYFLPFTGRVLDVQLCRYDNSARGLRRKV